ncbi:MAG: putative acetyltransferase [Rhizobacter sp.]|nr:putative acetyltransferase [Rhizobacter sp.]
MNTEVSRCDVVRLSPQMVRSREDFGRLYIEYLREFSVACDFVAHAPLLAQLIAERWVDGFYAKRQGMGAGFCIYSRTYSAIAVSPAYQISDLFVDGPLRRAGTGNALMQAVVTQARAENVRRIYVQTDSDSDARTGFYAQCGFVDAAANLLKMVVRDAHRQPA